MNEEEYLQARVEKQQVFFSSRAEKYKRRHYFFSVVKLAASLGVTALSWHVIDFGSLRSVIVAVLSLIVSFTEGLSLLCRYDEAWVSYRMASEKIKREAFLYKAGAGEYDATNDKKEFKRLVQNVEAIIQDGNKDWQERFHKTKEEHSSTGA